MERSAVISPDGLYRYRLDRRWGPGPAVTWVMLNPSTADGEQDDPTIRRCLGFTREWGFDAMAVVNLFAYRATKPAELWPLHSRAVGPDNLRYISEAAHNSLVVAAWGADKHPQTLERAALVLWAHSWQGIQCLGHTRAGAPRHPLYVPANTLLEPYPRRELLRARR